MSGIRFGDTGNEKVNELMTLLSAATGAYHDVNDWHEEADWNDDPSYVDRLQESAEKLATDIERLEARVKELSSGLKSALPVVKGRLETIQEFVCDHDEDCTCPYEAELLGVVEMIEPLMLRPSPEVDDE